MKKHFETEAIHTEFYNENNAINNPLYLTSSFYFNTIKSADDAFSFKTNDYVYTRGNNPTIRELEKTISILEKGEDSVAFSSGMGAISGVLMSLLEHGDSILAHTNIYGSSHSFIKEILPKYGIDVTFKDLNNISNIKNKNYRVIFFETPTNPSLELIDIEKVSKYFSNSTIVVDNTFSSPYLQNPLDYGADIVLHSATKYLSGHGDVLGGTVTSKDKDYINKLKFGTLCEYGSVISPFNAWLILRGLKTLHLRMERHCLNAEKIVGFLSQRKEVEKIYYPGFNGENVDILKKQMRDSGGILSFEISGEIDRSIKFVNSLKLLKISVSLGDTETLIQIPSMMTHRSFLNEDLEKFGFKNKTIRISAGLENHEDIIFDLERGFKNIER